MVQIKRSSEYFYEKSFRFYRPIKDPIPQINSEKLLYSRAFFGDKSGP
jgi:hypothetical protein